MKSRFGVQACHLLHINSQRLGTAADSSVDALPDPWSRLLAKKLDLDVRIVRNLVNITFFQVNYNFCMSYSNQNEVTELKI